MAPTTLFAIGVFTVVLLAIFVYVSVRGVANPPAEPAPFDELLGADAGETTHPLKNPAGHRRIARVRPRRSGRTRIDGRRRGGRGALLGADCEANAERRGPGEALTRTGRTVKGSENPHACILRPPTPKRGRARSRLLLLHLPSATDLRMRHVGWTRATFFVHQYRTTLLTDVTITSGSRHIDLHSQYLRDKDMNRRSHQAAPAGPFYVTERRYACRSTSCRTVIAWLKSPIGDSTPASCARTPSSRPELSSCDGETIAVAKSRRHGRPRGHRSAGQDWRIGVAASKRNSRWRVVRFERSAPWSGAAANTPAAPPRTRQVPELPARVLPSCAHVCGARDLGGNRATVARPGSRGRSFSTGSTKEMSVASSLSKRAPSSASARA